MKKLKLYIETQGNKEDIKLLIENPKYNSAHELFWEIQIKMSAGDDFIIIEGKEKKSIIGVRSENIANIFVEEVENVEHT